MLLVFDIGHGKLTTYNTTPKPYASQPASAPVETDPVKLKVELYNIQERAEVERMNQEHRTNETTPT